MKTERFNLITCEPENDDGFVVYSDPLTCTESEARQRFSEIEEEKVMWALLQCVDRSDVDGKAVVLERIEPRQQETHYYSERALATAIGISHQCLAQWRTGYVKKQGGKEYRYAPLLEKGVHWIQPGREVLYTRSGVKKTGELMKK